MSDEFPSEIDEYGNIYVHGRDAPSFRLLFDGTDLTGKTLFLEIYKVRRTQIIGDDTGVLLELTNDDLEAIPPNGTKYVIRDETARASGDGDVILDGNIRWHGWNKQ